jgi:hypothetical protein
VQEAVYRCLIRATDGKKKVTTTVRLAPLLRCRASAARYALTAGRLQVSGKEHVRFQDSFGTILKVNLRGNSCVLHACGTGPTLPFPIAHCSRALAQAHMDNLKRREKVKPAKAGKKPG